MRALTLTLLALLLSACAGVQKPLITERDFTPSDHFIAEGKLGIRSPELTESARFVWRQQGDAFLITLLDPFGRRALRLEGDDRGVELEISGEERIFRARSPEQLMQAYLGWQVPVRPAKYWIQGVPAPQSDAQQLDPKTFLQSDWTVELSDTQNLPHLKHAPRRVKLERDNLRLTLLFSNWTQL